MAATIYVIYKDADGSIVSARYGDPDNPPVTGAGETCINVGVSGSLPTAETHKVDVGQSPPAVVTKTQSEIDVERNNLTREELRRHICIYEAARDKYDSHGWATTNIDAKIAELIAIHDAIPV